MSDLQDLIHKTSMDCLERGKLLERERIIKLLEEQCEWLTQNNWGANHIKAANFEEAIELIKGETNG